ncbi:MAG: site-2 protease family protein [Candidatus Nanoarchaeia archaeon]|jgi:Zn-dependent protease|nr:site-2 protease family protein [Candidatus Nanoarchaeia archaeon]|tara:strand:- start:5589 stop:6143 length:555 start_codon:yes stop_codon:yes gene_type:complete
MKFSQLEIKELIKAWLAISIAFGIVLKGNFGFIQSFILAALTVGVGFLLHELAHKVVAQRYRCWAEFRAFDQMLILAILMSFFGFVLAAPGAVFIRGNINNEKNGKISVAGPITNIVLAILFYGLLQITTGSLGLIASYGLRINSWLALFNMIPVWNFDGSKIIRWNKIVYAIVVIIALILMII